MPEEQIPKSEFLTFYRKTFKFSKRIPILLLIIGDLISILTCFFFSAWFVETFYYPALDISALFYEFQIVIPVFLIVFGLNRLYPGYGNFIVDEIRLIWITITLTFSLMAVASLFVQLQIWIVKSFFFLCWGTLILIMPVFRHITKMIFSGKDWWGTPVVIIGSMNSVAKVYDSLTMNPFGGYVPVACFVENSDISNQNTIKDIPVYAAEEILSFDLPDDIKHAVIVRDSINENIQNQIIEHCLNSFNDTIIINSIHGISSFWLLFNTRVDYYSSNLRTNLLDKRVIIAKRLIDLVLGIILGILSLPLIILSGLLLFASGTKKIIYSQIRMGLRGQEFKLYKLRTMREDADKQLEGILSNDNTKKAEFEKFHKLKNDPRITKIGKLLRKFSIDELPQFWNVVKGDMSIIGPRAYLPEERQKMKDSDKVILNVKPGITGLWQVTERNDSTFYERCMADVFYIRHWSLSLDFYIFIKTIWVVITGKSSF